jgi:hypothetical protein
MQFIVTALTVHLPLGMAGSRIANKTAQAVRDGYDKRGENRVFYFFRLHDS